MERRQFIRMGVGGGVAAILVPSVTQAAGKPDMSKMAGSVYYTKAHPGRWGKKVSSHLPMIETGHGKIQVVTGHPMNAYAHYITKHTLLDSNFAFLTEVIFDPAKNKKAVSQFNVGNYSGTLYVLSHCNKHDTWMNQIVL
jgi:superoxide reductase